MTISDHALTDKFGVYRYYRAVKTPSSYLIPRRHHAADPEPFALGGGDLVPDAFGGDFALELSKRQQNIPRQPSHRCGGVELLGNRKFFRNDNGQWQPSAMGLAFYIKRLPDVVAAFENALDRARAENLLSEGPRAP